MRHLAPLQCNGSTGLDLNGLNSVDRKRIQEVGFNQWLDEISGVKKTKQVQVNTKESMVLAPVITNTKVKPGSVGYTLALAFFKLAKEHNNIVTYEQAAKLCPAYPHDPALWCREMGADVVTERKNKRYVVRKYI